MANVYLTMYSIKTILFLLTTVYYLFKKRPVPLCHPLCCGTNDVASNEADEVINGITNILDTVTETNVILVNSCHIDMIYRTGHVSTMK